MPQLKQIFLLLFLGAGGCCLAQTGNRPVPRQAPTYTFTQFDTSYYGYYLTAPFKLGANAIGPNSQPELAMILDHRGYLLWYLPTQSQILLDFKYLPELGLFTWINNLNPSDIRYMVMNTDFAVVDSFTTVAGIAPDLHEFQIPADQTYLLAGASDSTMDLSAYTFNGAPGSSQTRVIGFVVQELDEHRNVLFQWDSNQHIHPTMAYAQYGYNPNSFDYCHGNSIQADLDGGYLLSFRHLNALYKIDKPSGQVKWILGGKNSSFTFANDNGFSGQHDARRLPNGNITVFDNANSAAMPKVSRAVEYALDTINWVATKVWEYRYQPGFFSLAMGNHQTTEDRLHLINYGINYRPRPSFVLVNDQKAKKAELFLQDSFMSYRSFLFDLPLHNLQRPVITCTSDGNHVTLTAPPGFDRYEWSTGDSAASITVQQPGAYQVWVNHGPGMLGSEPFLLSTANCGISGTNDPETLDNDRIIAYFDLLGRRLSLPEKGQICMVRFSNGRAALRVVQEE